jgi:hypothetical protein
MHNAMADLPSMQAQVYLIKQELLCGTYVEGTASKTLPVTAKASPVAPAAPFNRLVYMVTGSV